MCRVPQLKVPATNIFWNLHTHKPSTEVDLNSIIDTIKPIGVGHSKHYFGATKQAP